MKTFRSEGILTLALTALAAVLRADDPTALDTLLATPISTAAKYDQTLSNVAASVTVITGEEIERYGWTALPDVLQSIPGFYATYDRNYTYIGVRGIGRPSDYNNRIMVLQNGISLNGDVFGSAPMPELDAATIERIEVVRGPGSALYGSHAMLAVVNIITKTPDAIDGAGGSVMYGTNGKQGANIRLGKVLVGGMSVSAWGHWQRDPGADLYFKEFDSPANPGGVARGLDYEELNSVAFELEKGTFRLTGSSGSRTKGIPTASFGTMFNVDSNTRDKSSSLTAEYELSPGVGKKLELRGTYQRDGYKGFYPYDVVGVDDSTAARLGAEARFHWDIQPNQRLTSGMEVIRRSRAEYNYAVGDYQIHLSRRYTGTSFYLQDEYHPSATLGIIGGVRYDSNPLSGGATSPRAAILFTPNRETTVKLLYGTAFRAPNVYESEFEDPLTPWKRNPDLRPESIRTAELVLEQRLSPELFFVGSLFRVSAKHPINQEVDPVDNVGRYVNLGSLASRGLEMNVLLRRESGMWAHLGLSTQTATDSGNPISNSPGTTIKGGVSTSASQVWSGGLETIFESSRRTRDQETTPSLLLLNGTLSRSLGRGLRAGVTVSNLLDRRYATPVGPELLPQSIVQDGRTIAVKLSYSR